MGRKRERIRTIRINRLVFGTHKRCRSKSLAMVDINVHFEYPNNRRLFPYLNIQSTMFARINIFRCQPTVSGFSEKPHNLPPTKISVAFSLYALGGLPREWT